MPRKLNLDHQAWCAIFCFRCVLCRGKSFEQLIAEGMLLEIAHSLSTINTAMDHNDASLSTHTNVHLLLGFVDKDTFIKAVRACSFNPSEKEVATLKAGVSASWSRRQ